MKKVVICAFLLISIFINVSAHEQFEDGWYVVKSANITASCKYENVWAYYKNGVEIKRQCRLILAHRGWGEAPENSLESIKMVKEKGYDGYETDIQFTKDNIPVLSHDSTINRIARNKDFSKIENTIYIKDLTLKELYNYVFVTTTDGEELKNYANNKITTFEEALKYSRENGLFIGIELKIGTKEQIASLVRLVQKYKMDNKVRWISYNAFLLEYVKDTDPDECLNLLYASYKDKCSNNDENYCGTEAERKKFHKLLNTDKNIVYMKGDESIDKMGYGTSIIPNLPKEESKYPINKEKLNVIKSGSISLNTNIMKVKMGDTVRLSYKYDGDGEVKCTSSNKVYVKCKVDKKKKQIIIKKVGDYNREVYLYVYATQGIKYSATKDFNLIINTNEEYKADINGNGKIEEQDYVLIRDYLMEKMVFTLAQKRNSDVNDDSKINIKDYILVKKSVESEQPITNNS